MAKKSHESGTLCPGALGMAAGVLWGLAALVMAFAASGEAAYGAELVQFLGSFYLGYEATVAGAFIGFVWAFLDGFIGAFLFASLYNWFIRKACKCAK